MKKLRPWPFPDAKQEAQVQPALTLGATPQFLAGLEADPLPKFRIGDKVSKVGGNYQADGVIVARFRNTMGQLRYVFEFDAFPGMLHIFTGEQLTLR